ncbi:MAG TPA: hypothetical protein VMS65_05480 [Polyangiaceae bacterium]|nr:hypothetical protein [Polyangiaceae bacterium]
MATRCEVCSALGNPASGRTRRVNIAERSVALCPAHALVLAALPLADTAELRALFRESGGQRSLVGRREALDRRAFPPRPEGRRRGGGRRSTDSSR